MEGLINAAQGYMNQGGQQGGNNNGGGGGGFDFGDISSLVQAASNHSQQNGQQQDSNLFSQVASHLQNQQQQGNINPDDLPDDQTLQQQHEQVVNGNQNVDTNQIGNAAAIGALKSFLGGGNNNGGGNGGGNMQSQLIGMAMSHAGALFDQKNDAGLAQGSKNDAMASAGQAMMQMMIKNQMSGMIGGGNSGGLGGLASLASKFM